MKYFLLVMLASTASVQAQSFVLPPIPNEADSDEAKKAACDVAINEVFGWQLGDAKRLREWCRQHGVITYRQQLDAERMVR